MNPAKNFSKIAIGQIQIRPEDLRCHEPQILQIIQEGKKAQVDFLIFPGFSTTGYLPENARLFPDFYQDCQALDQKIAAQAENITIAWGSITYEHHQVIPTIFLAQNKNIIAAIPAGQKSTCQHISLNGNDIAVEFSWDRPQAIYENQKEKDNQLQLVFYTNPTQELAEPYETTDFPTIYLHNHGLAHEGKQVFVLPGSSKYITPKSKEIFSAPFGKTGLFPLDTLKPTIAAAEEKTALLYERTVYGIRAFMAINHLKKAVIGLSGGIDSALGACLYEQAIGKDNVLLINMPSRYNSNLTQSLAKKLSEKLGCFYGVFPIEDSITNTISQLENTPLTKGEESLNLKISGFTGENIQARDRGSRLLAAIAQSVSGVFTANCNKTEIAVGYATMYGDQAGFLAATGNLWKHEVYALARYMDEHIYHDSVLADIINLKPSAELSPQQDITKGLGDPLVYAYHDRLLAAWEDRETPLTLEEILNLYMKKQLGKAIGCDQAIIDEHFPTAKSFINDLEKWWRAYEGMANVKRLQSPPILIVHNPPQSLCRHRLHSPYFSSEYLKQKADLLK